MDLDYDWNVYKLVYDPVRIVRCSRLVQGKEIYVRRFMHISDCINHGNRHSDVLEIDGEFYMCPSAANRLRAGHGNPELCTRWTNKKNTVIGLAPVMCLDLIVRVVGFL